jgi:hypothetical protein
MGCSSESLERGMDATVGSGQMEVTVRTAMVQTMEAGGRARVAGCT